MIETDAFAVTPHTLSVVFVGMIYIPICLIVYRWLFPRLSSAAKRLASVVLVAQVILIIVAYSIRPYTLAEEWLWSLHLEWNIAAAIASTQLALIGGVALLTAKSAQARSVWQMLYFAGVGCFFFFAGLDEFFSFVRAGSNWSDFYTTIGVAIALTTAITALRSPRETWKWYLLLLFGLAMSALGAVRIDRLSSTCNYVAFIPIDGCFAFTSIEEVVEVMGGWLSLVAMLGHFSGFAPALKTGLRRALYAWPAIWILMLVVANPVYTVEYQLPGEPAWVQFESGVQLFSYQTREDGLPASAYMYVSEAAVADGQGYSVHLVDQVDGSSLAGLDKHFVRRSFLKLAPGYAKVYQQSLELAIPPQAPINRALRVVLTVWRKSDGEFVKQKIVSSDIETLDDTQVVLGELTLRGPRASAAPSVLAEFENGILLTGAELPKDARAGDLLNLRFDWYSQESVQEDHIQFLHFGHEDSGEWWVYDRQPLGERLPTRLWHTGLADSETWRVPLPSDLAPGQYKVFTGLYRTRDKERIPVTDALGMSWRDARALLGTMSIASR